MLAPSRRACFAAALRGVNLPARRVPTPRTAPMSLFLDIGTGAGLASATGVRPYLPPLLAGGLARGDIGIDFDGTDFSFLESPAFLAAVVALGVLAFLLERSRANRSRRPGRPRRSRSCDARGVIGVVLGALLFAGALADNGHPVWIGLVFGPLCAALALGRGRRPGGAGARAARARPGGAAHRVRRRRGADPRRDRGLRAAARVPGDPGFRRCCSSAAAGARARSTPG